MWAKKSFVSSLHKINHCILDIKEMSANLMIMIENHIYGHSELLELNTANAIKITTHFEKTSQYLKVYNIIFIILSCTR